MNEVASQETVAAQEPVKPAGGFFREDLVAKEGKLAEGWSGRFEEMGLGRLAAKGAQSKDEASFWKMLDDTIGHASKKMVSRPGEGAAPQELSEYPEAGGCAGGGGGVWIQAGEAAGGLGLG
ncbi:hypothetical protein [Luteolibacter sp. Populi]|uniref:hypothetical protein n=1 Tax=Luteolibacter sp. Populi TaxID=3230487 RepID=UPI003466A3FD